MDTYILFLESGEYGRYGKYGGGVYQQEIIETS
jgi:hypothetical protein